MTNEDEPISKNYFQWKLEIDIYEDDVTEMSDLFWVEIVICIDPYICPFSISGKADFASFVRRARSWLHCFMNETVNGTLAVLPRECHRDCSANETRREGHH